MIVHPISEKYYNVNSKIGAKKYKTQADFSSRRMDLADEYRRRWRDFIKNTNRGILGVSGEFEKVDNFNMMDVDDPASILPPLPPVERRLENHEFVLDFLHTPPPLLELHVAEDTEGNKYNMIELVSKFNSIEHFIKEWNDSIEETINCDRGICHLFGIRDSVENEESDLTREDLFNYLRDSQIKEDVLDGDIKEYVEQLLSKYEDSSNFKFKVDDDELRYSIIDNEKSNIVRNLYYITDTHILFVICFLGLFEDVNFFNSFNNFIRDNTLDLYETESHQNWLWGTSHPGLILFNKAGKKFLFNPFILNEYEERKKYLNKGLEYSVINPLNNIKKDNFSIIKSKLAEKTIRESGPGRKIVLPIKPIVYKSSDISDDVLWDIFIAEGLDSKIKDGEYILLRDGEEFAIETTEEYIDLTGSPATTDVGPSKIYESDEEFSEDEMDVAELVDPMSSQPWR